MQVPPNPFETLREKKTMAYVRGARRHPMFVLTITPEMEEQIEQDLTRKPRPRSLKTEGLRPCGTVSAYNRHKYRGEKIDEACRAANARACAERKARRAA